MIFVWQGSVWSIRASLRQISETNSFRSFFKRKGPCHKSEQNDNSCTSELEAAKQEVSRLQGELEDMHLLNSALLKDMVETIANRANKQAQDDLPSAKEIGLKLEARVSFSDISILNVAVS